MSELNATHFDQTHRIFISSPKPIADRTGLYIIILLFFLLFILIVYLFYNFISFKRYCSSRRKNNLYLYSENHLSTKINLKRRSYSYDKLIISSYRIPLQPPTSLSINQTLKQLKKSSLSDQHQIKTLHVSDL